MGRATDLDDEFRRSLETLIPHMRAFAHTLCQNAAQADDLTQNALLSAWKARARFEAGSNMKAWTFRILRNRFFTDYRSARRTVAADPELLERTLISLDDPAGALKVDELRRAMLMLAEEQREALILIGAGGFSYEEAAQICGCAVGTIKSRVSRARATLVQVLEHGQLPQDAQPPGAAMGALLSELQRLSAGYGGETADDGADSRDRNLA